MKGLLIKDFRLLKSQIYFLLIVMGCVIVFMMNMKMAAYFYLPYRLQRKIM